MSQTERIKRYLERGNKLTPLGALRMFGCMRLASRIHELRKGGMDIIVKKIGRDGKSYAQYMVAR